MCQSQGSNKFQGQSQGQVFNITCHCKSNTYNVPMSNVNLKVRNQVRVNSRSRSKYKILTCPRRMKGIH